MSDIQASDPAEQGSYVYSVIRCGEPRTFGPIGIGAPGSPVRTVHYGELAAVVSDAPLTPYDPTRENLLAHQRVNETVMSEFTVLPLAFGAQFRSEADVVEILRNTHDSLLDVLRKMDGKVEFDLKVFWDPQRVLAEIQEQNELVRHLRSQMGSGQESGYLSHLQLGQIVQDAMRQRAESYVREVYSALEDTAVASRTNATIGEDMILNAAFLINRTEEGSFNQMLDRIAAEFEGRLSFRLSGPFPPYNFVRIRLSVGEAPE